MAGETDAPESRHWAATAEGGSSSGGAHASLLDDDSVTGVLNPKGSAGEFGDVFGCNLGEPVSALTSQFMVIGCSDEILDEDSAQITTMRI